MFFNNDQSPSDHEKTYICKKLEKNWNKRKQESRNSEFQKKNLKINTKIVDKVEDFKYLGRFISNDNNDGTAIRKNLSKARSRWAREKRILINSKCTPKVMGYFYKAIIQSVLLYGSESWVISESMFKKLESFNNKVARGISKCYIIPNPEDPSKWIYPDSAVVRKMSFY